jgi:hypothetical protein
LHVAPWAENPAAGDPPIIQVLRGDFFCMPFGANELPYDGEKHPIHGETANQPWDLTDLLGDRLAMRLETQIRPATVTKEVIVGDRVLYQRHTVAGGDGPMSFGHHAMIRFQTPGLVSTSPIAYGQVYPFQFEDPVKGGYTSLLQGAHFERLDRVPTAEGGTADLTRYPAREGFEDLVMVCSEKGRSLAWSAVVFPKEGYLWLSLKDPRVLTGTVLWHSNGGRHYAPWSGRHRGVLGVEEVTSFFHAGLAQSAMENEATRAGFETCGFLDPREPLVVSTAMLVADVPPGFDHVADVTEVEGGIEILSRSGESVFAPADVRFVTTN